MKLIARIVGSAVIIVVLACAALYILNEKGFIKGGLSDFINNMTGHAQSIHGDTKDFLQNEGYLPSPVPTENPNPTEQPDPTPIPTLVPVE